MDHMLGKSCAVHSVYPACTSCMSVVCEFVSVLLSLLVLRVEFYCITS